ncbi:MAG: SseB family protein [Alphaproteobacteria bacterium]|nr:MAG: SseB family protein [Alphaproteobacteria bacterium]
MTPLDHAHADMIENPDDDALRLKFYRRLADTTLFLLLAREPEGEVLDPEILEIDNRETANIERYALAFDTEERLGAFAESYRGEGLPYAALPGRVIAQSLAGKGVGLALNLDVAVSSITLPAAAMDWLSDTLAAEPEEGESTLIAIAPPVGLPDDLIEGLEEKLVNAAGLASHAVFVKGTYSDQREGWLLAFIDARPGAEKALARATHEALVFSGTDLASVDVAFFASNDPICEHLDHMGLRYEFPDPDAPEPDEDGFAEIEAGPGTKPDEPPILR